MRALLHPPNSAKEVRRKKQLIVQKHLCSDNDLLATKESPFSVIQLVPCTAQPGVAPLFLIAPVCENVRVT